MNPEKREFRQRTYNYIILDEVHEIDNRPPSEAKQRALAVIKARFNKPEVMSESGINVEFRANNRFIVDPIRRGVRRIKKRKTNRFKNKHSYKNYLQKLLNRISKRYRNKKKK